MGAEINHLYYHNDCGCTGELHLSDNTPSNPLPLDVKPFVEKALRNVFDGITGIDESLFKATFLALTDAVGKGFGKPNFPDPLYAYGQLLEKSTWPFAARKTAQQQAELSKLAAQCRSFGQFKKAASKIVGDYNQRWLQTEYDTAIRAGIMAERWQRIWQRRDVFPNLKYLPSRAATPREAHKALYGRIRPVTDPFWLKYYPPSAFLCQCDVEPTRDMPTDLPETLPPLHPSFQNNSGATGVLLRSDQYQLPNPRDDKRAINAARDHLANYDLYETVAKGVLAHWLHDGGERQTNIELAKKLTSKQMTFRLLPKLENRKNPDATYQLKDGVPQVVEFEKCAVATSNSIYKRIKEGAQQAKHVIVFLDDNTNEDLIHLGIENAIKRGANPDLLILYWQGKIVSITQKSLQNGTWKKIIREDWE